MQNTTHILHVATSNNKFLGNFKKNILNKSENATLKLGEQWLSGRVLDSRPMGRGFEPHRRHCVVVIEQDTFILA